MRLIWYAVMDSSGKRTLAYVCQAVIPGISTVGKLP